MSLAAYGPVLEVLHYFGIVLWVGSIALLDFRLMGFSRALPMHKFHLSGGAWLGIVITTFSGGLMFVTYPALYIQNTAFWVKMGLIVAATLTALIFHSRHVTDSHRWDRGRPPLDARIAGAVSLVLWFGVMISGRLIAYVGPNAG
jgi:hypothetical protein